MQAKVVIFNVAGGLSSYVEFGNKKIIIDLAKSADFSPVSLVQVRVEKTRIGSQTDLDLLELTVHTDQILEPNEAIMRAAETLRKLFGMVAVLGDKELVEDLEEKARIEAEKLRLQKEAEAQAEKEEEENQKVEETNKSQWDDVGIDEVNFSTRTIKVLTEAGVRTISELLKKTADELLDLPGFGEKSLRDLTIELDQMGLSLAD
jgi:DNA-directed RNA polymerase subunit alpha